LGIVTIPLANSAAPYTAPKVEAVTTISYTSVANPFAVDDVALPTPAPAVGKIGTNDPRVPGISDVGAPSAYIAGPGGQKSGLALMSVLLGGSGSEAEITVDGKEQSVHVGSVVLGHKVTDIQIDRVVLTGGITIQPSYAAYTLQTQNTTLMQPGPSPMQGPGGASRAFGGFTRPGYNTLPGSATMTRPFGSNAMGAFPGVPGVPPIAAPVGGAPATTGAESSSGGLPFVPDAAANAPFPAAGSDATANALNNFVKSLASPTPQPSST
jgi:hypothetical protein